MKKIIIYLIAILLTAPAFSQELSKKEQRELQKHLKKEQQAEDAAKKAAIVNLMVEHQRFVLEANRLRDKRGNTVNVSASINFIASDSINGVIQIGSQSHVGLNGVGGITVDGPISNYKYTRNEKNGVFNISYNVRTTTGTYDIRMTVFSDGRADATVSSNWPGQLRYEGFLVPPAVSRVYKGTSTY
ncbi:MAG: DUF4251 domain-containing protein [Bacteroidales bacterium]|nr:DUF4251 domain-containing protein [Bacteroidales bacterium]